MKKRLKEINIHPFAKQLLLRFVGVFLIVCIGVALFLHFTSKPVVAEWFDSNWSFRQRVNIPSHSSLENNVYVTVPSFDATDTNKFQADCGDLRFTKQNGQLLKYYVVDCDATANIHVLFDSLPAGETNYYMYYGNPSAPNGFQTVDFTNAATGLGTLALASEEIGAGPIAYWAMDEGQGQTVNDGTANNLDGTLGNTSSAASDDPTWQTEDKCISGKCLLFDGTDDAVDLSDNSKLDTMSDGISISSWVHPKELTGYNREVVSKKSDSDNTGYRFRVISNGAIRLSFGDGVSTYDNTSTSTGLVPLNQWTHIEVTYDYQYVTFYVNGKQIEQIAQTNLIANNSGELIIGAYQNKTTYWFNGYLDEVKIYPYARTAAQVKTDYIKDSSSVGSAAVMGQQDTAFLNNGLVGYWKMDETSSPTTDSSGNGIDGSWLGDLTYSTGKFGNAISTDTNDDYVWFGNPGAIVEPGSGSFTYTLWVNVTSNQNISDIPIYKGGSDAANAGYDMELGTDDWIASISDGTNMVQGTFSASPQTDGTWSMLSAVINREEKKLKIYLNGQLVDSVNIEHLGSINGSRDLRFGGDHTGSWDFYGKLDEVRIYNRSLSDKEIQNLYYWAPGPIAYWNLDENAGTSASDISGNEKTGTLNTFSSTPWVPSKFGSGLLFDGTSDYITIPSPELPTTDYTYEAWVNIADDSDETIFSIFNAAGTADEFSVQILNSTYAGRIEVVNNDGTSFRSTNIVNKNVWTHVAVTRSGSTIRIYINGVQDPTTSTNSNVLDFGSCTLLVGADADNAASNCTSSLGNYFNGRMDDLRIYNYARSPGQIVEDMNGGHPLGGSPVGSQRIYLQFDDNTGTTAQDSSINNNDGTIVNATWTNNGKINKALNFDSTGDWVTVPDAAFDSSLPHTITAWVNAVTFTDDDAVIGDRSSDNNGTMIYVQNGNICSYVSNTEKACITAPSTNVWHHLALTFDGTNVALYIDGVFQATDTATVADGSTLYIGTYNGRSASSFDGKIDEVKVYSGLLTVDQIKIDMNAGASLNFGTTASSQSAQLITGPGNPPILYWNLDENTGTSTVADKSGNSRTGTLNGIQPVDWKPGKIGSALNFDRINNSVSIADASFLTPTTLSTTVWLNIQTASSELGSTQVVYEHEHGSTPFEAYSLYFDTDNRLYCKVCNTSDTCAAADSGDAIVKNRWYHTTCTWDGSNVRMYLNSVLKETTALSGSLKDGDGAFAIGAGDGGGGNLINALLDEFKMYDYTLNQTQISYDYNRGAPIAWWKFDECEGTTIYDASGNGNNGAPTIGASGSQTAIGTCTTSSTAWGNGATGKFGSSINLDGTDDYVSFGDPSSGMFDFAANQDFSFSLWVNFADTAAVEGIFGKSNGSLGTNGNTGFDLIYRGDTDKGIYFRINDGTTTPVASQYTATNLADSTWHHITVTADRDGNSTLYVDGNAKDSDNISGESGSLATSTNLVAGRRADSNSTWHFSGKIDDVRLYNYIISQAQIKQIMNEGSSVRFGQ